MVPKELLIIWIEILFAEPAETVHGRKKKKERNGFKLTSCGYEIRGRNELDIFLFNTIQYNII